MLWKAALRLLTNECPRSRPLPLVPERPRNKHIRCLFCGSSCMRYGAVHQGCTAPSPHAPSPSHPTCLAHSHAPSLSRTPSRARCTRSHETSTLYARFVASRARSSVAIAPCTRRPSWTDAAGTAHSAYSCALPSLSPALAIVACIDLSGAHFLARAPLFLASARSHAQHASRSTCTARRHETST